MFNPNEVLNQLTNAKNGAGRLKAMIGAKNFMKSDEDNWILFKFMGGGCVKIILNSMDTYDMEFLKIRKGERVVTKRFDGLYCDMLKGAFEDHTKLCLSF